MCDILSGSTGRLTLVIPPSTFRGATDNAALPGWATGTTNSTHLDGGNASEAAHLFAGFFLQAASWLARLFLLRQGTCEAAKRTTPGPTEPNPFSKPSSLNVGAGDTGTCLTRKVAVDDGSWCDPRVPFFLLRWRPRPDAGQQYHAFDDDDFYPCCSGDAAAAAAAAGSSLVYPLKPWRMYPRSSPLLHGLPDRLLLLMALIH